MQSDEEEHEWRSTNERQALLEDLEHHAKQSLPIIGTSRVLRSSEKRVRDVRTAGRDGSLRHIDNVRNEDGQHIRNGDDKQKRTWQSETPTDVRTVATGSSEGTEDRHTEGRAGVQPSRPDDQALGQQDGSRTPQENQRKDSNRMA